MEQTAAPDRRPPSSLVASNLTTGHWLLTAVCRLLSALGPLLSAVLSRLDLHSSEFL